MDSEAIQKPLLLIQSIDDKPNKKTCFGVSLAKLVLKFLMWAVFISWVSFIFLLPVQFSMFKKYIAITEETVFGITGSIFLLFSAPILFISILAVAYLVLSRDDDEFPKNKAMRYPGFRLWTFPVIVDGPFGVVSAAEFIGILLFCTYVIWAVYVYTLHAISGISDHLSFKEQSILFLDVMGVKLGSIGIYCLAFLFLPVSRGSVLLRLIDIPFEHATKYHVWLGHLTMLLFTLHGLCYIVEWALEGRLLKEILGWKDIGVANLAGVISLAAGLVMWVTSLPFVRKFNFELFFYSHQLYVVFIVFLALHIGDFIFCICLGGIFLFMLDRFLRFCQSRRVVEIVSAKCLPCGTVELTLSKPACVRYNALSFVFLQIRELSWFQWHPFSVSSSPLDGKHRMSVLIKVLGGWTAKLRSNIKDQPLNSQPMLTASVEGPYGHESPYHLMYENLVLVAGGIGISPFLAIISDILHRVRDGKPCLPRNISIIWAVKYSTELPLLSTVNMESICPFFSDKLSIETHIYVTRESEPPLEEGNTVNSGENCAALSSTKGCKSMSGLVGTGHKVWSGLYLVVSTFGFIASIWLLDVFYVNPYGVTKWWYRGLLLMLCMAASIIVFGGSVIGLWHLWETKTHTKDAKIEKVDNDNNNESSDLPLLVDQKDYSPASPVKNTTRVSYGVRPDFKEILERQSKRLGSVDVGVIVCGPLSLQTCVATHLRTHNFNRQSHHPFFHFNSHSFDL